MLKKQHKKLHTRRGRSLAPKKEEKGAGDEPRLTLGHSSSLELGLAMVSPIGSRKGLGALSLIPGSNKGTQHLAIPSMPKTFQVTKDLLSRPEHQPLGRRDLCTVIMCQYSRLRACLRANPQWVSEICNTALQPLVCHQCPGSSSQDPVTSA